MAHVINNNGKFFLLTKDGWVNERGDIVTMRVIPDHSRVEYKGEQGDKFVEMFKFGGRAALDAPAKMIPVPGKVLETKVLENKVLETKVLETKDSLPK